MVLSNIINNIRRILRLLIPVVLFSISLNAQENYIFDYYTMEDGLSHSLVDCIINDKNNFVWIGTWNGLNRFDGYSFETYKHIDSDSSSLNDNFIYSLCPDTFGNIWIGTSKGLSIYLYKLDYFVACSTINEQVNVIKIDNNGNLWIGGNDIIKVLKPISDKGKCIDITPRFAHNELSDNFQINDLDFDEKTGNVWIGTQNGVFFIDPVKNQLIMAKTGIGQPLDLFENLVYCTYFDSKEQLWVGTAIGLIRYDLNTNTPYFYNSAPNGPSILPNNSIHAIIEDRDGQIIVGSFGGLSYFNPSNNSFKHIIHEENNKFTPNNNFINCIYTDKDGIVWIGTERGGLNKYSLNQKQFFNIEYSPEDNLGLNEPTVNSICEDEKNLWIGTAGGGLNRYNLNTRKFQYYVHNDQIEGSLSNNFVSYLAKGPDGNLYVASWGGGLHRLMKQNYNKGRFQSLFTNELSDNSYFISSLVFDHKKQLWIGTVVGIVLYNIYSNKFLSFNNQGYDLNGIGCMQFDNSGNLWIGSINGLFLLKADDKMNIDPDNPEIFMFTNIPEDSTSISGNYIISLHIDKSGQLWIGTYGHGINNIKFNPETKNITAQRFNEKNGLTNNITYQIQDDNDGNLWISTGFGLSKFEIKNNKFRNYYQSDGLINNQYYWTASCKNENGRLYFGGTDGLTMFDPQNITVNNVPPILKLTGLNVYNKPIEVNKEYFGTVVLSENITNAKEVSFSYKSKEFTIGFAALQYDQSRENKYKYKLEGIDEEWKEADPSTRSASYTQLPGGEYTFKIMAANSDDVWTKKSLELKINIIPPFWNTWWFRIGLVVLILLISMFYYFIRVSSLKKQKVFLEKVVKERIKEIQVKNEQLIKQTEELNESNTLLEERQQYVEEQAEMLKSQKENLEKQNEQLEILDNTKNKLFSIIAHDLKSPFTSILGFCELILREYDTMEDEKKHKLITMVYSSGKNVFDLLTNLLFWARSQTGNITYAPEQLNLLNLLKEIENLIGNMIKAKNIELKLDIPGNMAVYGDKNMIDAVFRNIIMNSIKYTENGQICVKARKNTNKVLIEIQDTGVGIPKEKLENLFDLKPKKSEKGTKDEQGTGLGLIICKDFINKHGGDIYVYSEVNKGTTFNFTLPVLKS